MLYVHTFGGCHVERDEDRLEDLSTQRRALALLALLAHAGARGVSRDSASAMLWPESDEERARASLKQLVHSLRVRLATVDVVLTSGDLRLNPDCVASDVGAFREAVRQGDRATAARLYAGPFLDGFYLRRSDGFEHWVSEQRAALARDFVGVVRALAEGADQRGDHAEAVTWWQRLVDADPLSAPATMGLMRALDAAGDRMAALRHASVYQRLIRSELDTDPEPSVVALEARLRATASSGTLSSESRRVPAPPTSTAPARPTLVVLPFANTSGDPQDEPFSDGLTDELIGTIGKIRGISVVGRTSAFAFKGHRIDLNAVATRLNATSVLEGSVRRVGERYKIGVQLVSAPQGVVLWSEIYERDAKDLFAVQAAIARWVSLALRVRLEPQAATAPHPAVVDPAAHDLYLRGRYFLNRVSPADLGQAVACFERAVERDPTHARAFAGLADTHLLLAIMGLAPAVPQVSRVHAAVARALALDAELAEAHTSLACVLFAFDWDWDAAEREFERAIALDPGYGLAHHRYGLYLMYRARFDEAQQVLEEALAFDPLAASVNMNLGRLHLSAHRAQRAVPLLQTAVELSPQLALAHEQLGHAYLQLNASAEALAAFRRTAELSGPRGATRLAYALAATGDHAAATKLARELADRPDAVAHAIGLAMAHSGLGDRDGAFAWLDRAYAERDAFLHTIKVSAAFEPLHVDPRWESLLQRIGLSDAVQRHHPLFPQVSHE
jgi:DNA-binding SARP family transcriptional activator/Flp pilus assembly protein TadD